MSSKKSLESRVVDQLLKLSELIGNLFFFPANHSDSSRSRTEAKYHLNFRIFKFSEKEGEVESGFSELVDFNLWEFESSNFWVWQFFGTTGATPGSDADRFRPPYQLPTYWKSNTRKKAQGNCFLITKNLLIENHVNLELLLIFITGLKFSKNVLKSLRL